MPLHVSSTCVHRQEVKIVLYSLWYHHTYRWPSRAQVLCIKLVNIKINKYLSPVIFPPACSCHVHGIVLKLSTKCLFTNA